ncbi:MAG: ATP synthase subunit I [Wenzhouxiangellaceae bacterium]|nr:ATP synthase subunit I [Wenzhouxiangellaceae bacterium]
MSTDSGKPQKSQPALDAAGFARAVVWLLRTQAVMAVAAAIVSGLLAGAGQSMAVALAVLAGGGIGIVLTALSALRAGAASASGDPEAVATAFYRGMFLKMALAVVMFVIVAALFAKWFLPVMAGYVVTLVAYWIALLRVGRQVGRQHDPGSALNDE